MQYHCWWMGILSRPGLWARTACSFRSAQADTLLEFMYHSRIVLSVGASVWYMIRNLRCTVTIDSVLANSKTQNSHRVCKWFVLWLSNETKPSASRVACTRQVHDSVLCTVKCNYCIGVADKALGFIFGLFLSEV